jgi:hypothetical protein
VEVAGDEAPDLSVALDHIAERPSIGGSKPELVPASDSGHERWMVHRDQRERVRRGCELGVQPVELVGPEGVAFAKGIAGAGADELTGRPRGLEAVHRDKLVLY